VGKTTPSPRFLAGLGDGTKERTNINQKTARNGCFLMLLDTA